VTSILASDMPQIIENERKEKEEKRLTKEKGNKNEKKKRAQKSKEKKQESEDDSDIFSLRDSNDSINLLDLVQDVEFDNEEDFCATPKPSRIKGLQEMSSDYGGISQQPSTSTSDKEEVLFHVD